MKRSKIQAVLRTRNESAILSLLKELDLSEVPPGILDAAAWYQQSSIVKYLLEKGFDPNARGIDGQTAMQGFASYGDKEMCSLLLSHGADINAGDKEDVTPLHEAILSGRDVKFVRWLLDRGANPTAKDAWLRKTPIALAGDMGSYEIVVELMSRGCDPSDIEVNSKGRVLRRIKAARYGTEEDYERIEELIAQSKRRKQQ